jgi:hypothetical protein
MILIFVKITQKNSFQTVFDIPSKGVYNPIIINLYKLDLAYVLYYNFPSLALSSAGSKGLKKFISAITAPLVHI